MADDLHTIGKSVIRKDATAKATGEALYTGDLRGEETYTGLLLRSPHHHARLLRLDKAVARSMPGVLSVITADDIPGNKLFGPLIADQSPLAFDKVIHLGQPVALIVGRDLSAAQRALDAIRVEYEPLPAVFDPEEALADGAPQLHPQGNLCASFDIADGDLAAGFAAADLVVEETFNVPRISPAYLEPEASVAQIHPDGLTVWVSSQKPFADRHEIASVLGCPEERVRVKSAVVGGAFGGREDASLAVLAALGAWVCQGNVRLVNRRSESFLAHPKRHPVVLYLKGGVRKDGILTALHGRVYLDTGAFASYGPAVGGLLTEMMTGAYAIPNVRVETRVVYTNSPMSGAMRGFGSPQAHFGLESLIDILAVKLALDPLELRRRNILRKGDRTFTGVTLKDGVESLPLVLARAHEERERMKHAPTTPGKRSGVGFALCVQTMGLGAHIQDTSTQRLEWMPDGAIRLYLGAPDLGQGLATVGEQITAEELGLPYGLVRSAPVDTDLSPNGGVTCASRMTYLVGNSLRIAARKLVEELLQDASRRLNTSRADLSYSNGVITVAGERQYPAIEFVSRAAEEGKLISAAGTAAFPQLPEEVTQNRPAGMPHGMFVFGGHVTRVEVDPELGSVEVKECVAIHDVGKAINRAAVEGQVEGAVVMGIGYALFEEVQLKPDCRWVDSLAEYLLPTAVDVPPLLKTILLELPEATGPFGAKGVGEMGLVPVAPAIANAVYDAVGVRARKIPLAWGQIAE